MLQSIVIPPYLTFFFEILMLHIFMNDNFNNVKRNYIS